MMPSSEAGDNNALYNYAQGELQSNQWLHAVYGEVTENKGARLVIVPKTLSPGITAPQDKVCKEYLTELEAFPREATGLAFVNFSIKEHLRPPGCGGLAVIGAQRVLGEKDHAGRDGPIWKHAVFASAGPQNRAPIALDQRTLWDVATRLHECLSAVDENSRLFLAREFSDFQGATAELAKGILLEHLRRLDPLIERAPESTPPIFRARRVEGDAPRGVFYVSYDESQVGLAQLLAQAAKLATILYCSDFPWLSVELQCEDRQRDSGSLPGWVVRFVREGVALNNSSRRVETYDRLFVGSDESLSALASRFFAKLGWALESPVEAPAAEHGSLSSPIALRLNDKGLHTILSAQPVPNLSKLAPTTDKVLGAAAGRQDMSEFATRHRTSSSTTPTDQVQMPPRVTDQTSAMLGTGSASGPRPPDAPPDSGQPGSGLMIPRGPVPMSSQEIRGLAMPTSQFPMVAQEIRSPFNWLPRRVRWAAILIWAVVVFIAAVWTLIEHVRRVLDPNQYHSTALDKPPGQPPNGRNAPSPPEAVRAGSEQAAVTPIAVSSTVASSQSAKEDPKSDNGISLAHRRNEFQKTPASVKPQGSTKPSDPEPKGTSPPAPPAKAPTSPVKPGDSNSGPNGIYFNVSPPPKVVVSPGGS